MDPNQNKVQDIDQTGGKGIFESFFGKTPTGLATSSQNGTAPGALSPTQASGPPVLFQAEPADEPELRAYWRTLRAFFRTGRGGGIPKVGGKIKVLPALMSAYRDGQYAQVGYPFWMADQESEEEIQSSPLKDLLLRALQSFAPEDGKARILKDNLMRLEVTVAKILEKSITTPFRPVIDRALSDMEKFLAISGDEGKSLRHDIDELLEHLPSDGLLISYSPQSAFSILAQAVKLNHSEASNRMIGEIHRLSGKLRDALSVEREKSPEGKKPESLKSSFDIAEAFMNYDELAAVLPETGSEIMPLDRQKRIQKVLNILDKAVEHLNPFEALILLPNDLADDKTFDWSGYFPGCKIETFKQNGCIQATRAFDTHMEAAAKVLGAARIGQLEVDDQYSSEIHGDYFAHFDWRSFTDEEMATCSPVILIENVRTLMAAELTDFSNLLASNRPIKTLAIQLGPRKQPTVNAAEFVFRQELAAVAISHRNTYVLQTTGINPDYLFHGFSSGMKGYCPAFFYLLSGSSQPKGIEPYLWTSAAVEGRYFPSLTYDPREGGPWGSRFHIDNNPHVDADWANYDSPILTEEGESTVQLQFTFADFASLDPRFQSQYLIVPSKYWNQDLISLPEYLLLNSDQRYARVPFVWMVDDANQLLKVAVSWSLVLACQERLDFWHFIQENCGVRNFHVEHAIKRTRQEVEERLSNEADSLKESHLKEIEEVRQKAAGEAMEKLTAVLLDLDSLTPVSSPVAPKMESREADQESVQPEEATETKTQDSEEEDLFLGEPWIESILCTTCNECTDLNGRMFQYNGEKQAQIADPKAGTFEELVIAAENCPPK